MAEWDSPHYAALVLPMKHYLCTSRRFRLADTLRVLWAAKIPIRAGHLSLLLLRLLVSLVLSCDAAGLHLRPRAAVGIIFMSLLR